MDEKIKKISSVKRPGTALVHIEGVLEKAYQAPQKYEFSADLDEKIVRQAVLYHRLREDKALSGGEKNEANDKRYDELAKAVIEGRDPVAEFIRTRSLAEQVDLLQELMVSDKNPAWFEEMVTRSAQKKEELATVQEPAQSSVQLKGLFLVTKEKSRVQAELYQSLAENRSADPQQFFSNPQNLARAKRMLAAQLYIRKVEHELKELQQAYEYVSDEAKSDDLKNRKPFSFEQAAAENMEEQLKKLENSQEVYTLLQKLTQSRDIKELGKAVENPPSPEVMREHENIALMENKLIPDAVRAFLNSDEAPEAGSKEEKLLNKLSAMKEKEFPDDYKPSDCRDRIKEYRSVLKNLEKAGLFSGENGKKLRQELESEVTRLNDVANAPDREKIKFNFRADTLIDYVSLSDPDRKPMDAMEAREKLINGEVLEQQTFNDDDFAGVSQELRYDKSTGLIVKGPEKLITRVMNLSEKAGRKPQLQLEELRKIQDVLKKTDPFYVKNSESYNNVLDSLNKVIKTQQSLDKNANVRQVAELRALYAELDSNAAKYVKEKSERMKTGDNRAQIRLDAVKTLQSLTGEKHVGKVTLKLYDEQKRFDFQQKMASQCNSVMRKWNVSAVPSSPKALAEFKKDFDSLSDRFDIIQSNYQDTSYFKMGIAEDLEKFTKNAQDVQKSQQDPEKKPDAAKLQKMIGLKVECSEALNNFNAMEPAAKAPKKENKKDSPVKDSPKKAMAPV